MARFFDKCLSVNANFTRIDIAIDDYKTYLKVPLLIKKAEKAECVSRFRAGSAINGFNLSDGRSKGATFILVLNKAIYIVDFMKRIMNKRLNVIVMSKTLGYGIVMKYKCERHMQLIVRKC